jgi:hypothetical protein
MGNGSRVNSVRGVNRPPAERPESLGSIPAGNQWYSPVLHIKSRLSILSGELKNNVESHNDLLLSHFLQLAIRHKSKVVPLDVVKSYAGNGGIVPVILQLGITCRRVVSFMSRHLYSRTKETLVTNCTESCVGPGTDLGVRLKR